MLTRASPPTVTRWLARPVRGVQPWPSDTSTSSGLGDVRGKPREHDGVEPLTTSVPVGPEHPLVAKAGPVHKAQCRHILRCHEHLEAAKAEGVKSPTGDERHRFGRDAAAMRRRNQTAPELA